MLPKRKIILKIMFRLFRTSTHEIINLFLLYPWCEHVECQFPCFRKIGKIRLQKKVSFDTLKFKNSHICGLKNYSFLNLSLRCKIMCLHVHTSSVPFFTFFGLCFPIFYVFFLNYIFRFFCNFFPFLSYFNVFLYFSNFFSRAFINLEMVFQDWIFYVFLFFCNDF